LQKKLIYRFFFKKKKKKKKIANIDTIQTCVFQAV
jgi:hypothetical protein